MAQECRQCGNVNPEDANFCARCGQPVAAGALRPVIPSSPLAQQWRRLKFRMTRREVRSILGEPARIEVAPGDTSPGDAPIERWTYAYRAADRHPGLPERGSGRIDFAMPDGIVFGWKEPDWPGMEEWQVK